MSARRDIFEFHLHAYHLDPIDPKNLCDVENECLYVESQRAIFNVYDTLINCSIYFLYRFIYSRK